MDPRERLRLALIRVGCSRCGQPYPIDGVNVLAQREGIAFVQLDCPSCETRVLALVTGSPEDDEGVERAQWTSGAPARDGHPDHPSRRPHPEPPAIDESDVDEMHRFLVDYHGDLRTLLGEDDDPDREGSE